MADFDTFRIFTKRELQQLKVNIRKYFTVNIGGQLPENGVSCFNCECE